MREQDSKQRAELQFWKELFQLKGGAEGYLDQRRWDYRFITGMFPGVTAESGLGLDLACGMVSIFEFSPMAARVVGADFLMNEYDAVYRYPGARVRYQVEDGEMLTFGDNAFDWVMCANTIDHTPHPERMIAEIRRVLRSGGHLYLWVNFDRELTAPHYELWDVQKVQEYLQPFHLLRGVVNWHDDPNWATKYCWWGLYRNVKALTHEC